MSLNKERSFAEVVDELKHLHEKSQKEFANIYFDLLKINYSEPVLLLFAAEEADFFNILTQSCLKEKSFKQGVEKYNELLLFQRDILQELINVSYPMLNETQDFFETYQNLKIPNTYQSRLGKFMDNFFAGDILEQITLVNQYKETLNNKQEPEKQKELIKGWIDKTKGLTTLSSLTITALKYLIQKVQNQMSCEKESKMEEEKIEPKIQKKKEPNLNQNQNIPKVVENQNQLQIKNNVQPSVNKNLIINKNVMPHNDSNNQEAKVPEIPQFQLTQSVLQIKESLLDREKFIFKEVCPVEEDHRIEYKMWYKPWDDDIWFKFKRTICSFLNSGGGCLFIGMKETQKQSNEQVIEVIGVEYTNEKFDCEKK